jgi:OmpR-family two-component system manganese-sensing response regulator
MTQILLVDDEEELTAPLQKVLQQEGYTVAIAHTGTVAWQMAQRGGYHLLILDWILPQLAGIEICRRLRARGDRTPVLLLTARDTLEDRVAGLDSGADDYLVKPFELRELLARVRALLRRSSPASPLEKLVYGDLELDPHNRIAYRGGQPIPLSEKECQLLAYFLRFPQQVLTHQQISQYLWADAPPTSNALTAQIKLLRKKIDSDSAKPALINTVYGKGYRFG